MTASEEAIDWDALAARDPYEARDGSNTAGDAGRESDAIDDLLDAPIVETPPAGRPQLVSVRQTLRPSGDSDSYSATVRNAGDAEALVSEIIFQPMEVVELSVASAIPPEWGVTNSEQLVILLDARDNRTTTSGRHGAYGRELDRSFAIAAGQTADIKLAIDNEEHVGWGLQGRLTLRVVGGDDLEIENVALAFVRP
jgi:hypothetical protein